MKIYVSGVPKTLKAQVEKYQFEVGIIDNVPLKRAKPKTQKTFAGGPARMIGKEQPGKFKMQDLGAVLEKKYKWLRNSVKKNPKGFMLFMNAYISQIGIPSGTAGEQRILNLLQAAVRNPILRGDHGKNKPEQARRKGFNRLMIDTSRFFGNIKARVIFRGK